MLETVLKEDPVQCCRACAQPPQPDEDRGPQHFQIAHHFQQQASADDEDEVLYQNKNWWLGGEPDL